MDGASKKLTIQRSAVDDALASLFVYRTDDGDYLTFDEAFEALTPMMAEGLEGLPAKEQVIHGGEVEELIFETGIYLATEARGRLVTRYTEGQANWTPDQLRDQVFLRAEHADLRFEDWLAAQVDSGALEKIDVLQYIGYEDEDAEDETVLTQRRIVDD